MRELSWPVNPRHLRTVCEHVASLDKQGRGYTIKKEATVNALWLEGKDLTTERVNDFETAGVRV